MSPQRGVKLTHSECQAIRVANAGIASFGRVTLLPPTVVPSVAPRLEGDHSNSLHDRQISTSVTLQSLGLLPHRGARAFAPLLWEAVLGSRPVQCRGGVAPSLRQPSVTFCPPPPAQARPTEPHLPETTQPQSLVSLVLSLARIKRGDGSSWEAESIPGESIPVTGAGDWGRVQAEVGSRRRQIQAGSAA